MTAPRLIREAEEDAQLAAKVRGYAADADLLGYMRRLLADTETRFDAAAGDLRAIGAVSFGRKTIRSVVEEIDREARNRTYASRAANGLSRAVDFAVDAMAGTFTGRQIFEHLQATGYQFAAKRPRQACYHALLTLIDAGRVAIHTPGRRGVAVHYVRPESLQLPLDLPRSATGLIQMREKESRGSNEWTL